MKINGSSDWEKINNSQNLENSEYLKNSENDYSEKDIFDFSCGDGVVDENSIFVDEENKQIFIDSDLFAEEVIFEYDENGLKQKENSLMAELDIINKFFNGRNFNNNVTTEQATQKNDFKPESESEDLLDKNGNIIGNVSSEFEYNENGDILSKISTITDIDGNIIGTQEIKIMYDELGNIIEIKSSSSEEKEDGTKVDNIIVYDKNKIIKEESVIESYPDGSKCVNKINYDFTDENKCTNKVEKIDKDGNIIYSMDKTIDVNLKKIIKKLYSDCEELKDYTRFSFADDVNMMLDILEKSGNSNVMDEVRQSIKASLNDEYYNFNSIDENTLKSLGENLKAKVDLMVIDENNSSYKKDIEKAVKNNDMEAIQKLYKKIYNELYPEGTYEDFTIELQKIYSTEYYYENAVESYCKDENLSDINKELKYLDDNFAIREDYNAETDTPENFGEMMLYEMQQLKNEYLMYKNQMGSFDRIVSLCNVLGFGTSEYEINEMFDAFEQEIKYLTQNEYLQLEAVTGESGFEKILIESRPMGANFINKFEALTGQAFSEQTLQNYTLNTVLCSAIDDMSQEQLEKEAKLLEINIDDAKKRYGFFVKDDKDYLAMLIKAEYRRAIFNGITTSPAEKKLDDYKNTVQEHRDLVIDVTRTALVIGTGGQSILLSGAIGACVETVGIALNSNALGREEITTSDAISKIAGGIITSMAQGGATRFLNGLGYAVPYNDPEKAPKAIYWAIEKIFKKTDHKFINKTLFKLFENMGIKGIGAKTLGNLTEFLLKDVDLTLKVISNNATDEEVDKWINELVSEIAKGTIDGLITGSLLTLFSLVNKENAKKLVAKINQQLEKINFSKAGIKEKIIVDFIGNDIAQATGKAGSRLLSDAIRGKEIDLQVIFEKEIKEITKEICKPG